MKRAQISVNKQGAALADTLIAQASILRLNVTHGARGETLVDAGGAAQGGIEAGLRIAEICMGGLGEVRLLTGAGQWPHRVQVRSSQPVLACLGSQYAGWNLSHGAFFALGSGPARALAQKETIFADIGYCDEAARAVLVLESAAPPPPELVDEIAKNCGISASELIVIYASTQSLAGGTQVVARALEVALHKAHSLHFALADIVDGIATAPLAPPHPDFVTAMGRTNDAIIFGGQVHLFVSGDREAAEQLAKALPSSASRDYGLPFAQIFRANHGDFYKIDPMLFSPAHAIVTHLDSGNTFFAGQIDEKLVHASFS